MSAEQITWTSQRTGLKQCNRRHRQRESRKAVRAGATIAYQSQILSTSVKSGTYRYMELYVLMRAGVLGINNIVIVSKLSLGHVIAESARKE
jgi:hypothetical protein